MRCLCLWMTSSPQVRECSQRLSLWSLKVPSSPGSHPCQIFGGKCGVQKTKLYVWVVLFGGWGGGRSWPWVYCIPGRGRTLLSSWWVMEEKRLMFANISSQASAFLDSTHPPPMQIDPPEKIHMESLKAEAEFWHGFEMESSWGKGSLLSCPSGLQHVRCRTGPYSGCICLPIGMWCRRTEWVNRVVPRRLRARISSPPHLCWEMEKREKGTAEQKARARKRR